MSKEVIVYMSLATAMLKAKKNLTSIKDLFAAKKVSYSEIDVSLEENDAAKKKMQEISGKRILPQVHVDGKYIGGWDELEMLNETGEFSDVFGV